MYVRKSFLFAMLALVLAGLACSGPGDLVGPKAPETWQYDEDLGLGDDVNSYSADFKVNIAGTDNTGANMEVNFEGNVAAQRDPAASKLEVTTDLSGGGQSMSADEDYVFVDGMYHAAGNASGSQECYGSYEEDDVPFTFGELLDYAEMEGVQDFMKDLPDLDYIGDEDGNWHYQGEGDVQIEGGEMQNVVVDAWIEPSTGHVVKLEMTGEFDDPDASGDMSMNYELTSVNEDVEIEAPNVCD